MKLVGLPINMLRLPLLAGGLCDSICPIREAHFPGPIVSEMGPGFKAANQGKRTKRVRLLLNLKNRKPEKSKAGGSSQQFCLPSGKSLKNRARQSRMMPWGYC